MEYGQCLIQYQQCSSIIHLWYLKFPSAVCCVESPRPVGPSNKKNWILTGSAAAAGDPSKSWCYFDHLLVATWTQHVCEVRHVQVQIPPIIWIPFIESTNWFLISENLKDNSPWTTTIFFNPGTDVPLPPAHGAVRIEMDHKTLRC